MVLRARLKIRFRRWIPSRNYVLDIPREKNIHRVYGKHKIIEYIGDSCIDSYRFISPPYRNTDLGIKKK